MNEPTPDFTTCQHCQREVCVHFPISLDYITTRCADAGGHCTIENHLND